MIISVASGKGGTGKTTVAVNLTLALQPDHPVQFLDCDVEEPNAHFFLKPRIEESREVFTPIPEIDERLCNYCGKCAEVCAYNALAVVKGAVLVFSELCHGCGACSLLCPEKAIREVGKRIGVIESGRAGDIRFIHGRLDIGQAMSPPLIRALKKNMDPSRTVVIDAPPGTSCPVIESLKSSEFCLLVTEPTPFGRHDLELAAGAAKEMKIPCGVVINRASLGCGDGEVRDFCTREEIPVLMTIPFDRKIAEAYSRGQTILEAFPVYRSAFLGLFENIKKLLS
ncbi:MAG TPA: (4Fe-4S)-binding protein [Candidatus Aminicenantes bacterium]|nr:(4Fe-4S)-binding protein [Candidatus Aminicenantes bacterium]